MSSRETMKTVLVIDDNPTIVELIKYAINLHGAYRVVVAYDGEQGLERVYADKPDCVVIDVKMPRMDGFEVLRWVRLQPGFSSLLVVVLTSSEEIRDVNKAYQLGANSFLVKPHDFQQFTQTCHVLKEYWLNLNKGPEASRLPRSKSTS